MCAICFDELKSNAGERAIPVDPTFKFDCLPLSYSGNPGANGKSYRGDKLETPGPVASKQPRVLVNCGHSFHGGCLGEWAFPDTPLPVRMQTASRAVSYREGRV